MLILVSTVSAASAQVRDERSRPDFAEAVSAAAAAGNVGELLANQSEPATVRRSDPLWNGAAIGAGVAVASGLFLCTRTEPWANCRDDVGPMLRIGAIGAGVGIAIDALIRERRTIPQSADGSTRLLAAPLVGRRAAGLQFSLNF